MFGNILVAWDDKGETLTINDVPMENVLLLQSSSTFNNKKEVR